MSTGTVCTGASNFVRRKLLHGPIRWISKLMSLRQTVYKSFSSRQTEAPTPPYPLGFKAYALRQSSHMEQRII